MTTKWEEVAQDVFPADLRERMLLFLQGVQAGSAALYMGAGQAAAPLVAALADKNFLSLYTKSTAATGDSRNTYLRHYLSGAGGGVPMGDCFRAYTTVDGTGYNSAQGIHGTVGLAETGAISGLACGIRATLGITAAKTPGGTVCALQVDSDIGSGATVPTENAFIRVADNGAVKLNNLFNFAGIDTSAMFTGTNKGMRCRVNGVVYYVPFVTQLDPLILPGILQLGATATAALMAGGGTAASPLSTSTADKNFAGFWTKTTAATGDNRGWYLRHYLGSTGGGECLRAFTTVSPASDLDAGTAHGAHLSLSFGDTYGKLSGLGLACRNTLHIPNRAITLGTMAAHQAEIFMDGTSSNPTATRLALYRGIVDGGDATAKNKLTHLMDLVNLGAAIFMNQSAWAVAKVLKICVNGVDYYLPLSTAA